jgi:hypothetical protein
MASSGLPGTTSRVEVIGERGTDAIGRIVDVLTTGLRLPLPVNTRVHVYTSREAFRRGLVQMPPWAKGAPMRSPPSRSASPARDARCSTDAWPTAAGSGCVSWRTS